MTRPLVNSASDVCFAIPHPEIILSPALESQAGDACMLGFRGVVTGSRAKSAAWPDNRRPTRVLHLGRGLAMALANLHNARRALDPDRQRRGRSCHLSPSSTIAPLTSDIDTLRDRCSPWVGRARTAADVQPQAEEAIRAAVTGPGISTLILRPTRRGANCRPTMWWRPRSRTPSGRRCRHRPGRRTPAQGPQAADSAGRQSHARRCTGNRRTHRGRDRRPP